MQQPVALVTGGSRGIGRAVCQALARQGYQVVAVGRDESALAETASLIDSEGGHCWFVPCDVRDAKAIETCVQSVLDRYGRIDVLVNNAGGGTTGRPTPSYELPDAEWVDTLHLNLTSVYRFCKAVSPGMIERRSGCIVNVASVAARQASNLSGVAYTAAKSGMVGLTRHLAKELGPFGIRINTVAPGIIASPRVAAKVASLSDSERQALFGRVPLGRLGDVAEVASVVGFLASSAASYVHGGLIDINGGLYMA